MLAIAQSAHLSEDDDAPFRIAVAVAERDDLRTALDWTTAHDPESALELACELENFWNAQAPAEGMRRLADLLERVQQIPASVKARLLRVYGGACDLAGEYELAERQWEEGLELYGDLGDDRGVASVEHRLAVSAWRRAEWDRVQQLTESSLELARGRFPTVEISGYWLLGQLRLAEGDAEGATALTRRGADMAAKVGWLWWESGQRYELLILALRRGDFDEAEREGRAALRIEREQENRLWALYTIAGLAQTALARDDFAQAALLWGAAENEGRRLPKWADERERRGGSLVGEARPEFLVAVERGRELELWDAVAIALGEDDDAQTVP